MSVSPLQTYLLYWPVGHDWVQLLHTASVVPNADTQDCVMNWPGGQFRVHILQTVSVSGVHAATWYDTPSHCVHVWQLYTPVWLQSVPSEKVPSGHTTGHAWHCTGAVSLHGAVS